MLAFCSLQRPLAATSWRRKLATRKAHVRKLASESENGLASLKTRAQNAKAELGVPEIGLAESALELPWPLPHAASNAQTRIARAAKPDVLSS